MNVTFPVLGVHSSFDCRDFMPLNKFQGILLVFALLFILLSTVEFVTVRPFIFCYNSFLLSYEPIMPR